MPLPDFGKEAINGGRLKGIVVLPVLGSQPRSLSAVRERKTWGSEKGGFNLTVHSTRSRTGNEAMGRKPADTRNFLELSRGKIGKSRGGEILGRKGVCARFSRKGG